MTAKRYFRVGSGRTLTLPFGLVEGPPPRISAPDVEHRSWNHDERPKPLSAAHRPVVTGAHPSVIALDVDRINGKATGVPFARFLAGCVADGDLVEITESEYAAATGAAPAKSKTAPSAPSKEPAP